MVLEMITAYLSDLFMSNGFIIAVGAYVVGVVIKQSLDFIPNKYIPLIGGILGALAGGLVPGLFPDANRLTAVINGLALGWAATGGYETIRNLIGKEG